MPAKTKKKSSSLALSLYKKIAISFVLLTALLLVVVFYFSTARARIIVIPESQEIKSDLVVEVLNDEGFGLVSGEEATFKGIFLEKEVEVTKEVEATGTKMVTSKLTGTATIFNKSSGGQALVVKTRLLNKDNVLFRIDERVFVPAGGSVEVGIYADDPESIEGIVEPGHWTIPGLWTGLQDVIYAETSETLSGGDREIKYVTAADVTRAKEEVMAQILTQVNQEVKNNVEELQLTNNLGELTYYIFKEDIGFYNCDEEEGAEVAKFNCEGKGKVKAVIFQKNDLENMIKNRLSIEIPDGLRLISFNKDNYSFNVDHYNREEDSVSLKVSAYGLATITTDSEIIDLAKIGGKNKDDAIYMLEQEKFVKEADIVISPFWLKKVPRVRDRVTVEIQ